MGGFDCAACQVVRLGDAAVSIMQYYKLHLFGRHILERLFSFHVFFYISTCKDVGKVGIQTNHKRISTAHMPSLARWKKILVCILSFPCLGLCLRWSLLLFLFPGINSVVFLFFCVSLSLQRHIPCLRQELDNHNCSKSIYPR